MELQNKYLLNIPGILQFIENEFSVVDKETNTVDFTLNKAQSHFIRNFKKQNIILKCRQLGFTTLVLAIWTVIFLTMKNQNLIFICQDQDSADDLLKRVKFFINSYDERNGIVTPLSTNRKSQLVNSLTNSTFYVGTAKSPDFGRSKTISALHLSEVASYPRISDIISGAKQALIPGGLFVMESTAKGYNEFKDIWDAAVSGTSEYTPHFYGPEWEYDEDFLKAKEKELGHLFRQEYPKTPLDAFITTGECYFDQILIDNLMKEYIRTPIQFQFQDKV